MSIYSMTDNLKQKEINLYGNSRLGICNVDIDVQNCNIASPEITKFTRGNKSYELNNHLGNVLATISDKHVQVAAPGNTVVDYYLAEVLTATDYYPFGMQMPQRQFYIDTSTYIVGTTSTTTSENNTTVVELYKHSFNDTPSVHPYVTVPTSLNSNLSGSTWTNSRNMWTNYASNTSMGKAIAFDNSTADTATVTLTLNIASNKKVGIKSFSFYNRVSNSGYRHWKMFINGIEVGDSTLYYTATGGTGNNTVKTTGTVPVKNAVEDLTGTITVLLKPYDHDAAYPNGNAQGTFRMDDFILNGYVNDVGGSVGSGYQYANKGGYRYGYQGYEKDNNIKGDGNSLDFGARIYDPRLGRFLSLDPDMDLYPSWSPYSFAFNNPIRFVDKDGRGPIDAIKKANTASNPTFNKAWKESFNSGGKTVQEVSFFIVKTDKGILKTVAYTISKASGSARTSYAPKAGETIVGQGHTHPYSISEGSHTGIGFSAGDIYSIKGEGKEYVSLVESGTLRYALVIEDKKKADAFFKGKSKSDLQKTYNEYLKKAEGTFEERVNQAIINTLGTNSGIGYYKSDADKKEFSKVTFPEKKEETPAPADSTKH